MALGLPLDYAGFDPTSLVVFRKRLLEGGKERYAFDRFVIVGREAGFIPDKVTLLIDTTWTKGAGAVQDTYTLLRAPAGYCARECASCSSKLASTCPANGREWHRKCIPGSRPQGRH